MKARFAKSGALALALTIGLLGSVALGVGSAEAAECKGKSKSACGSDNSCTYVNSYKTKTGKKVDGYCRKKGGQTKKSTSKKTSSAKKAVDDKKADAKKSADKKADAKKADAKKATKKAEAKKSDAKKATKKKPVVKKKKTTKKKSTKKN
ncbi:hypothetical protein [Cohaesibacter gelatinilyticus]|uniref:Uncharacterized protein n=1 Tax=Cohaesibacter gelatinilyticus TaxID=372072 RepID=A0A285PDG1_9HYPH|nr:hypothetical protein [Cohaesibacter gelatinilyticus]SNZ19780.1 hypothetical protein SAMN06265368_2872 [Cohaesibacter gelatinilyticus]